MADTSQDRKDGAWAGAPPPAPSRRPPSRAGAVLAVLVVVGLGGVLAWRLLGPKPAPVEAPPPAPAAAAAAPAPAGPPGPPPATAPTEVTAGERALLDGASGSPAYRRWLDQGDPINRWALVTANLAEGVVPRKALAFLAPPSPFEPAGPGGPLRLTEAGYRRFDTVGDVVASVDPAALAVAYRALHAPLEAAYRALGDPQGSLDKAAARALDRLARAPVLDQAPELEPAGGGAALYLFKDPKLEALDQLDKQLLRLGPRNGRLVRTKAAAIRQALGLAR